MTTDAWWKAHKAEGGRVMTTPKGHDMSQHWRLVPHDHTQRVPGCFRCDLSLLEVFNA